MKAPAFQFYPKQWLGDDKVMLMDLDAQGAHLRLMCVAWQQDTACSLPDDDEQLRQWASASVSEWPRIKTQVFRAWRLVRGRWVQEGLTRQSEKQRAYSESRSRNRLSTHDEHMSNTSSSHDLKSYEDEDVKERINSQIEFIQSGFASLQLDQQPTVEQVSGWIRRITFPILVGILADHPDKNALYIEKCVTTTEGDNGKRSSNRSSARETSQPPAKHRTRDFHQRQASDILRPVPALPSKPS